jgi:NADPH2:quinone reductase
VKPDPEEPKVRAIVVTEKGGPDVLELRDEPDPEPRAGQLLVDVEAIGVNFRDIYEREGAGGYSNEPPFIAGAEAAGTVAAVGEAVHDFKVGDRVAWAAAPGSYAERVLVPEGNAVRVPDGVPTEVAAAAILQGMTAHYLAVDTYPVQTGDPVLVHAAAGGVGLLLTQIVKLRGGRVLATTSTPEKAELARGAGADHVVGYDGFGAAAQEFSAGSGMAVVYDGIGQATFDESLGSLRPRGFMVLYGAASGQVPPVDPQRLHAGRSLYLTRPGLPHYTLTPHELRFRAAEVFGWVADGRLDVRIGARYPLEEARHAQEDLAARKTTGKVLLTV